MNTHLRKYLVLLSCCTAACLLAACATTRTESLRASASRLDDASSHFSTQIQYQGDDNSRDRVSRDAEALAKAAHNLDRALNKSDSRDDVEPEYRRVTDDYEQLHSRLADEGYADQNRQVLADFDRVTAAYRNVEAGMSRHSVSTRDSARY
jgi:gas vesicle protein